MITWARAWVARWRERRGRKAALVLIRQSLVDLEAEVARLEGVWHCVSCRHEGELPDEETVSHELGANVLWRRYDCPACGRHSYQLGGDGPLPVPPDYPLQNYRRCGCCPECGGEDTIPVIYGLPTRQDFTAACHGKVRLGGSFSIEVIDGPPRPDSACNGCGAQWANAKDTGTAF